MTTDQYLKLGQGALESVTTNPMMNVTDANNALRSAVTDFTQALSQDSGNASAKMGLVLANTFSDFMI